MPLILFLRMLSYWRAVNLEMVDASLRLLDRFEHGGDGALPRNRKLAWASRSRRT
jgi:hypothetical protein